MEEKKFSSDVHYITNHGEHALNIATRLWRDGTRFKTEVKDGEIRFIITKEDYNTVYKPDVCWDAMTIVGHLINMNLCDLVSFSQEIDNIYDYEMLPIWITDINDIVSLVEAYRLSGSVEDVDDLIFWINEIIDDYDDLTHMNRILILGISKFYGASDEVLKNLFGSTYWGLEVLKKIFFW